MNVSISERARPICAGLASEVHTSGLFYGTAQQDRLIEPASPWWRRRLLLLATLCLAAAGIATGAIAAVLHFAGTQNSVERGRLTIAVVERGTFIRDLEADGQIVAAVSPTLYAPAIGTVTLKVHAGDAVARGNILAVLDSPDLTSKLSQEEATMQSLRLDWQRAQLDAASKLAQLRGAYRQAQVDQSTAQRELDRSRKAYELGSYSELQMLKAQDALEKAQFALEQAKMNYDSQPQQNRFDIDSKRALLERQQYLVADLRRQVEALQIRSPVQGRVGQVQVADRATVAKSTPLLTVVDLSALEVEINVPESEARDLAPGMLGDLEGDGQHWKGRVSAVSPEVVNGEVVARLRFDGDKPEGLRQSERMSVRILIDRREHVLMIDRGSFVDQGGGFAYVVHGNVAERRAVRVGASSVQKVEILDGLTEGDKVVVSGADDFNGAARVIIAS